MAHRPFAFLFLGGAASSELTAESEAEVLKGFDESLHGMDDFSLQF